LTASSSRNDTTSVCRRMTPFVALPSGSVVARVNSMPASAKSGLNGSGRFASSGLRARKSLFNASI
jgi:hypothetical protein